MICCRWCDQRAANKDFSGGYQGFLRREHSTPVVIGREPVVVVRTRTVNSQISGICSPRVMTAAFEHVIGSTVRDACGPAQEILDTITVESILNAG
jgi:hypothetical protein